MLYDIVDINCSIKKTNQKKGGGGGETILQKGRILCTNNLIFPICEICSMSIQKCLYIFAKQININSKFYPLLNRVYAYVPSRCVSLVFSLLYQVKVLFHTVCDQIPQSKLNYAVRIGVFEQKLVWASHVNQTQTKRPGIG